MEALTLKSTCGGKGAQTAKTTLKKKNKVEGQALPGFGTCHEAEVSKMGWFAVRRNVDRWRTEDPEITGPVMANWCSPGQRLSTGTGLLNTLSRNHRLPKGRKQVLWIPTSHPIQNKPNSNSETYLRVRAKAENSWEETGVGFCELRRGNSSSHGTSKA